MRIALLFLAPVLAAAAASPQTGLAQTTPAIRNPAEQSAYAAAAGAPDAAHQAAQLEAFLASYPSSAAKLDALELIMADDQRLNDPASAERTARRILQIAPDDVRALGVVVFIEHARAATLSGDARAPLANAAAADAGRGMKALDAWPGPAGMSADGVSLVKAKLQCVFFGALGFERLVKNDDGVAKYYFLKAVEANASDVQTDFDLAVVDLRSNPMDHQGFWWGARAYALAKEAGAAQSQAAIEGLVKTAYRGYHGGDDGWDDLVALAETGNAPPDGFEVRAAPSAAELAVQAVQDTDPASLTVTDWEFILAQRDISPANREAANKVWAAIMAEQDGGASRLKLPVMVLSASRSGLEAAITEDNQKAGRADLHIVLAAPLANPPARGSMVKVIGLISAYSPQPFVFTMQNAEIVTP
jgi:hypothetical protein